MSGITTQAYAVGPEESKLVASFRKALRTIVGRYYSAHWLKEADRMALSDFINGVEKADGSAPGYFSTPYRLNPDFSIRDTPFGLADFREWILEFTSRLGPKHGLATQVNKQVVVAITDAMPMILAEQSKIYSDAMEQLNYASSMAKRTKAKEESLQRQMETVEARAHSIVEEKEAEVAELHESIREYRDRIADLSRAAEGQAQSLRSLTSMHSLDDAAHLTIQMFKAVEATLDQLSMIDVATQAVRQHKDSVMRELRMAQAVLSDISSDGWVEAQVAACLERVGNVSQIVRAYEVKSALRDRAHNQQNQSLVCKDIISDAIKGLERYEDKISSQWFKKLRKGYKRKLPAINNLIAALRERHDQVSDDGANAHQLLTEVKNLLDTQKYKSNGSFKRLYRDGNNFSSCLNDALLYVDRGLDGRVTQVAAMQTEHPVDMSLVENINTSEQLIEAISAKHREALSDLPVLLRAKTASAVSSLERASDSLELMSLSINRASEIRSDFVSAMDQSYQVRRSIGSTGVDAVKDAMRVANEIGCSIQSKLRLSAPPVPSADAIVTAVNQTPFADASAAAVPLIVFGGVADLEEGVVANG